MAEDPIRGLYHLDVSPCGGLYHLDVSPCSRFDLDNTMLLITFNQILDETPTVETVTADTALQRDADLVF